MLDTGTYQLRKRQRRYVEMLSECNIEGMSAEWIKRGDYYYYTKVLKKQESVDLFQSVSVPGSDGQKSMADRN